MDRPTWERIQEIYHSSESVDPSERSSFVATACDNDSFLVKEVNSLLVANDSSVQFLKHPVFEIGLKIFSSDENGSVGGDRFPSVELIGKTIAGRYLIEKVLGRGGMGIVYFARDLSLHRRPVVIKVLLEASLKNDYVLKKFRQEVEALSRIDHPGVVGVLAHGELPGGEPYIVMQYVNGITLRSQISNEGMDFERAALVLKQIGAALDDVHEKGIFHRDLKPENVMLQELRGGTELVKLVDFGIAKVKNSVVAPSTANNVSVGTVLYMSPEQLRGGERLSSASDIYSMAVIAYEMLTGRRPFNPASGAQLLEMHRAGVRVRPADLRTNLSTEAQAIILRALAFEPKDRYQSAIEFGNNLSEALTSGGSATHDVSRRSKTTDETSPPHQRNLASTVVSTRNVSGVFSKRSLIVLIPLAALICAAVIFGIYKLRSRNQPVQPVAASRSFSYWLSVQKMRDGKVYQEPFVSSGEEIFETGYKFRVHVRSPEPGHVYLFNEGPPEPDGNSFTLVYPTPSRDLSGPSRLVQTNFNTFSGQPGTENFWIVWSIAPIDLLESAKEEGLKNQKGLLLNETLVRDLKEFLTKASENKVKATKDVDRQQTVVEGTGNVLVKLAQFEHR